MLSALGERNAACTAYTEALALYRRLVQEHPAAFDPDVAMPLNNLGTVLSALGERDTARTAYTEALDIYWPLFTQWPQAFGQNFPIVLRNYVNLTGENADDPWWQLWQQLHADTDAEAGEQT